jgi:zinc protease
MKGQYWKICLCAVLAFGLVAMSGVFAQGSPGIPKHPRDLKYSRLDFTPPQASTYRVVLSNGVVGYFVEDHDLPLVNVSVTVKAGSYLDPAGKEGLASAVGSQMRAGGTQRWKAEEFDEETDFLAANISSGIGGASGFASVNYLAKNADKALELFFEMLKHPAFQQDRLDLFKSQSLQQMERRNDSTASIEGREWNRLLRGEKHFTNAFTTKSSIESLTREDLLAFQKKFIHPGNILLAVSGDFQTADMKARLEKAMADWTFVREAGVPVPKPEFEPVPGLYMIHKADVNQGRVSIGHIGIQQGNPDEIAVDLMNDILGGSGFTSRITNRVRSDEGLAYSAGSSYAAGDFYQGVFRAGFQSKSATCAQATQIVFDEIQRIRNEKVTAEELETIKNSAIETFPRLFSSAGAIASTFANDEFIGRNPKYWQAYRDKVRAVTVEEIQRVAQKYLVPEKLVVLAVGNVDDMLKGDPDKTQYSFMKFARDGKVNRMPLPDPLTMIYPKQ